MSKLALGDGTKLEYTVAGTAVVSGTTELVQDSLGVHTIDAAVGETAVLELVGEHEQTKKSGETWTAGENIYWHDGNSNWTTLATGATLRGKAAADATSGAVLGNVILVPGLA